MNADVNDDDTSSAQRHDHAIAPNSFRTISRLVMSACLIGSGTLLEEQPSAMWMAVSRLIL